MPIFKLEPVPILPKRYQCSLRQFQVLSLVQILCVCSLILGKFLFLFSWIYYNNLSSHNNKNLHLNNSFLLGTLSAFAHQLTPDDSIIILNFILLFHLYNMLLWVFVSSQCQLLGWLLSGLQNQAFLRINYITEW